MPHRNRTTRLRSPAGPAGLPLQAAQAAGPTLLLALALALAPALGALPAAGQGAGSRGPETASPEPVTVRVHVLAHDAKLIGTGVGGAEVRIREAESGRLLAMGVQRGGTGDTDRIVRNPHARGERRFDTPGAASFEARVPLDEPTWVRIQAAMAGSGGAGPRAEKTLLLIPGEDLEGDGVVLELHGFLVEILEVPPSGPGGVVRARVRMLCGCPTEPGGLWDADGMTVTARIEAPGRPGREVPMTFAGTSSEYTGEIPGGSAPAGSFLTVLVSDPDRGQFGMARVPLAGAGPPR